MTSQLEFVEVGQGVLSKSRVVISCSISFVSYVCGRVGCFEEGLCLFECFLFLCVCIVLAVLAREDPLNLSTAHPKGVVPWSNTFMSSSFIFLTTINGIGPTFEWPSMIAKIHFILFK